MDPIKPAEVQQAINQMSAGKSLGEDGLPPELFKTGGVHNNNNNHLTAVCPRQPG